MFKSVRKRVRPRSEAIAGVALWDALLSGLMSIGYLIVPPRRYGYPYKSDIDAMRQDWIRVGWYFRPGLRNADVRLSSFIQNQISTAQSQSGSAGVEQSGRSRLGSRHAR